MYTQLTTRHEVACKTFYKQEVQPVGSIAVSPSAFDTCRDLCGLIPGRKLDIVKIVKRMWIAEGGDPNTATLINCKHLVESMLDGGRFQ